MNFVRVHDVHVLVRSAFASAPPLPQGNIFPHAFLGFMAFQIAAYTAPPRMITVGTATAAAPAGVAKKLGDALHVYVPHVGPE